MWCSDPFLKVLEKYGYNVVRLPRTTIRPLQILMRKGSNLDPLGELATIFLPGPALPEITAGVAANITGSAAETGDVDASVGIPLLGNVVAAMGGSRIALEPAYHKAKSIGFEFLEVQEEAIQIAALDQYLAVAQLNPNSVQIKKLLEADSLYIVSAVLKSNKLNVQAKDDHNEKIKPDVSQLQAALGVGGKLAISGSGQESSAIQYSGGERLAFGFQAIQVAFKGGQYTGFERLAAGAAAMRGLRDPNAVRHDVPAGTEGHVPIGGADAPFVQFRNDDAGAAGGPARRGLFIGINAYAHLVKEMQLHGCVNDATVMHDTLRDLFGFPQANLRLLADAGATRTEILAAMDELVRQTGTEDVVVVHYSGHGSQVKDKQGDEPDGWDETIVPHDSGRPKNLGGDGSPNLDITDDEIYTRLLALSMKTSNLTLFFDSCHSATITRDVFGAASRRLAPDPREELPEPSISPAAIADLKAAQLGAARDMGPSRLFPVSGSYILIAGCRDEETSFEYTAFGGKEPVEHGALTYTLRGHQ